MARVDEQDGYYGVWVNVGKKPIFEPLGHAVHVTKIIKVHESGEVILHLKFKYGGKTVHIALPRGNLKKHALLDYAAKGMDVFEHTAFELIEFIQLQEEKVTPTIGHESIGWDVFLNKKGKKRPFFKGFHGIGYATEYIGEVKIKPVGELENYIEFIKQHILQTPLELAVAHGLSAVLVGFIGKDVDCSNIIFHIYGESTTGKTTFGIVAVAMGSKPDFRGHTLARRFNATENALLQVLVGNTGYPVCFDEAKSLKKKDFSSFIYSLESGTEKLRLDRDTAVKSVGEYRTSIVTTAEFSLSEDSEHATGKELRLQEFGNKVWSRSAESAEAIKKFFIKNYGLPCVLLAEHLLDIGKEAAIECFNSNRQKFIEASTVKDQFTERLSIKFGMVLATVELANEVMELGLSYNAILKILVENEASTAEARDLPQLAYEYVLGQINTNIDKFSYREPTIVGGEISSPKYGEVWGLKVRHNPPEVIDKKKCRMTIYIQQDKMTELLQRGNFKDTSVIIKAWKQRNLLDYEKGRNTRFRKISELGTPVHVYGIRFFGTLNDEPKKPVKMRDLDELDDDMKGM